MKSNLFFLTTSHAIIQFQTAFEIHFYFLFSFSSSPLLPLLYSLARERDLKNVEPKRKVKKKKEKKKEVFFSCILGVG